MIFLVISLSLLFIWSLQKTSTFILSRGSLENHTRFQTIMIKIYTRFQTKTAQKPHTHGAAHTYIADKEEYPPSPPPYRTKGGETQLRF